MVIINGNIKKNFQIHHCISCKKEELLASVSEMLNKIGFTFGIYMAQSRHTVRRSLLITTQNGSCPSVLAVQIAKLSHTVTQRSS